MFNENSNTDVDNGKTALWLAVILLFLISVTEGIIILSLMNKNSTERIPPDVQAVNNFLTPNPSPPLDLFPTSTPPPESQIFPLNRELIVPVRNSNDEIVGEIKYLIKEYEKTNQVVVNNQRATMTDDRIVLAFNIEITNDTENAINIMARDYLRLSINGENWAAPDIHNDPVDVRSQATKTTRVGFPINKTDTNLKLQIGEVEGEKEIIDLN